MKTALLLGLLAATSPMPDPPTRYVTPYKQMFVGEKTFLNRMTLGTGAASNADAGSAYVSSCVPRFADLGRCPAGNGLQCVRDAGWYACQNDAGWAPIGTGASGGGGSGVSSVGATQPIVSSGGTTPTLSCTPASDTVGGCLTDGGQAIGGQKYFTGGVYSTFVDAGSVAAGIYESAVSSSLLWRSHAPVNTAAMDVFTDQTWTGGDLFQINNLYQPAFSLDYTGKGTFSGGLSMYGVLKQTRGGTAMLEAADGDFVASVGELPSGYDGRHGVFTVISSNETKGGWLLELSRGVDGNPLTSNMLIVDMIGGITGSYSGTTCAKLTQCGGGEQINPDGGHQGILDGGWGYSADSAMVWLTDKNRWVYCLSSENRDAGQFGTGAGWLKMKDDTAACP